ncbi:MAG TPA: hypothetical protein VH601_05970 [Bryobacteraceae bacterium]
MADLLTRRYRRALNTLLHVMLQQGPTITESQGAIEIMMKFSLEEA